MREKARGSALESLIGLDHASHEIYSMAHKYMHRCPGGAEVVQDLARIPLLLDLVDQKIMSIRIALNGDKRG